MQHCEFCGYLLPEFARFCGNCGRIPGTGTEAPSNISTPSDVDVLSLEAPTFISSPSHPVVMSEEEDDLDVTIRRLRSEGVEIQSGPFSGDGQTEETQAVLPDFLLPGALMADGQASAGNVPMVQGTPQMGGVPMVHGTPQVGGTPMVHGGPPVPGSPTTGQSLHHGEASPTHLSPHTPPQYHGLGTSPAHPIHPPPQPIHPPAHPIYPPPQPIHPPPQPIQPPTRGHKQHHTGQSHTHRQHTPPHHKGPRLPRLRLRGSGLQWIMVAAVAIVALVSGALGLTFALLPPAASISLIGSSSVVSGGTMHLHGKGFVSGGSITLTLDNRVPLSYQEHIAMGEARDSGGMGAALHMLVAGQASQPATSQGTIRVRSDGTFDTTVVADANWSLGSHTLRATEDPGSRSATLPFNFIPGAKLSLRPTSLDLGKLSVGSKVSLSIIVNNTGGQRLKWTADTGGTTWLKVVGGAGLIERGSFQQVTLLVDTSHLKARDYSAILHITSNGGHKDVGIKLNVTRTVLKQAKLYVDPTSLDFGKLAAGQPMTLTVTVGNVGTKVLNWTTDIGNTSWLSLDTNAGMIQPGGQPQTIQVTADSTGLAAGNHSATLQINSDGGSASVGVTLVVAAPPPGGLTPTPSPPQLAASPNGFSAPGDPNCSYNQTQGWACTVSLNSYKSAQGDLNWSSSSSVSGVTFAPSSGTLSPGQTAKVTVTIPNTTCPAQADFHFTGPGNAVDVLWSCAAPQLLASPTSFSNGCLSCTVTLALAQGSEGSLSWAATSSGISGITISQQSGTLTAGQTTQVTFTVPASTNCPAQADFHFTGPGNGVDVHVPWSCQLSPLGVSPTNINANTGCSYNGGWTCTVTLSSQQNAQSNINWSASGGISGTSFSPSNGTLSPGQSSKVTINVPSTNCPIQATITFSGGLNPVDVTWSCSPPTLNVSPRSFSVPASNCSYTSGQGWTCTATLSLKYPGDPNLDWSTFSSVGGCCPIQFTPSSGTLSAGQQTQVTITIPDMTCPTSLTLSFLPSGQNAVNVPWNCAAPTWSATPNQNICPQNSDGSWTCSVTVAEASSSQGDLAWSASSQLTGVTFSPQSGTLSPGKSVQVTIAVPANDCTNSSFNFSEQGGNTITIQVQCASPPTLAVSPTSLSDLSGSPCTYDSGSNSWTCTVTLTSVATYQANLNWSASSTLTGVSFSSQSGTLSPGQSVQVTISGIPCTSSSNAFTFSGGASPVSVSWNCGS